MFCCKDMSQLDVIVSTPNITTNTTNITQSNIIPQESSYDLPQESSSDLPQESSHNLPSSPFALPSSYLISDKNELKETLKKQTNKIFNTIYSKNFEQSTFTKILNFPNAIPKTITDIYISEAEKFADKKNGWLINKRHNHGIRMVGLNVIELLFPFIKNFICSSIIPLIETQYGLPNWSLDISDGMVLKFDKNYEQDLMEMHRSLSEFTFIIVLNSSDNKLVFKNYEKINDNNETLNNTTTSNYEILNNTTSNNEKVNDNNETLNNTTFNNETSNNETLNNTTTSNDETLNNTPPDNKMVNNIEIPLNNIGNLIIFNSRRESQFITNNNEPMYCILGSLKFMNGYKSKYLHNQHPNSNINAKSIVEPNKLDSDDDDDYVVEE